MKVQARTGNRVFDQHRVLGAEHPDTLTTRGDLAGWTGKAGDWAAARDQYAALLPIRERVLGAEHPRTLSTRAQLAYYTGAAGNAAGARDQYAALLPIRERVLGPGHPDILLARGNLARLTGAAGDAAGAYDQYAALLPCGARLLDLAWPGPGQCCGLGSSLSDLFGLLPGRTLSARQSDSSGPAPGV